MLYKIPSVYLFMYVHVFRTKHKGLCQARNSGFPGFKFYLIMAYYMHVIKTTKNK